MRDTLSATPVESPAHGAGRVRDRRVRAEATGQGGAVYRRVTFASGAHGVARDGEVLMYSDDEADAVEMFHVLVRQSDPPPAGKPWKRRRWSGGK